MKAAVARIPDAELERLKDEVSLERLVEAAGVALRRQGRDLVGCCPFHEDRSPSLVVSPEKNLWHCLGACQAGGSVIDWVMRSEGVSFRHAVELLRDGIAPTMVGAEGRRAARSTVTKLPSPLERAADDRELLGRVVGFYERTLRESSEALEYLERRGLRHLELVERFRLGYANRTLGYRLPAKNRQAGADVRGRLQRLGVLRESGHEHLSGSLVIPVMDVDGAVVQLYGRKIRDDLRAGTPAHLYLPGAHRGVFNIEALAASREVVLCESLIDALSFWCCGQRHVTAAYGVQGFTAEHLAAFKQHGVERVLIAYDSDDAGDQAAAKLAERLHGEGVECLRVLFPAGTDANALITSVDDPAGALPELLQGAGPIGSGPAPARRSTAIEPEPAISAAVPAEQDDEQQQAPGRSPDPDPSPAAKPPVVSPAGPSVQLAGDELRVALDDRCWRVRGLGKVTSFDALRLNVLVAREDARRGHVFHVDTLDLYSARARGVFCRQAAGELGVAEELIARDLGRVLLVCEERAEGAIRAAQAPSQPEVVLSDAERQQALELLRDPRLIERIVGDFATAGIVGEETNCLVGYLAAVSRKLDRPLAVIVQFVVDPVLDPNTGLQYLRARYYDPTTAQFLTPDPLEAVTQQPYSYANDNPIDNIDPTGLDCGSLSSAWGGFWANCGSDVSHAARAALHVGLDVAAVPGYAVYYGTYYAAKGINAAGAQLGAPGSVLSHALAAPLAVPEAVGLGWDAGIDWIKGHTVNSESICDEGVVGYINPLHEWLPGPLKGPRVYLPGIHGNGQVDFQW